MRSKNTNIAGLFGVLLLAGSLVLPVLGTPIIVRVEVGGVPQVLKITTGAHNGAGFSTGIPGYHFAHNRIYWSDSSNSGHRFFWLDPALMGDLWGSTDSKTGVARYWSTGGDAYAGTISGATKDAFGGSVFGFAYLTEVQSLVGKMGNGNGTPLDEIQAARSVSSADILTEGTSGNQTLSVRRRSRTSPLTTGGNHLGLAVYATDATDYYMIFVNNRASTSQCFSSFKLSKAYSIAPTATTIGARTLSGQNNALIASATVNGLVPGYDDLLTGLANDNEGRLWALSAIGGTNFVTAFTVSGSTLTQIDLDPDDDNGAGSMYVNLAGKITQTNGTTTVNGHGITVNADASRIYIAADSGGTVADSLFILKRSVPDIRNVDAFNVQTNTADVVGYLAAETATVTCYWGTNNGGVVASAWMTNTLMGTQTAPYYLTNSLSELINGTPYFFRYCASNSAGTVWASNTTQFVTLGVDASVSVGNDGGPINITATGARLQGEVLGGDPQPDVWIYWGTTDGGANKGGWDKPPVNLGSRSLGPFTHDLTGLLANQQYWYRCYASNANDEANEAWSSVSTNFTTLSPALSLDSLSLSEGASGTTNFATFTVLMSATSAVAVTVNYTTTDGTATLANEDYRQTVDTLTIPAGNTTGQIIVPVVGNNVFEADETFNLDLSAPNYATLDVSHGVGTIINDDWTWYVRCDGSGSEANNGSSWSQALASLSNALMQVPASAYPPPTCLIYLQATTGAQAYDAAARRVTGGEGLGHLSINFEGGWMDVDGTPVQAGRSLVKDLDGTIDERGLDLYSDDNHGRSKTISLNRLDFADVTDGVRIMNFPNLNGADIQLAIRNSAITANSNGVVLAYAQYGRIPLTCSNVAIRAGLSGLGGDGVYQEYQPGNMSFDKTTITSAKGKGINVKGICGVGWINSYTLTLRDSDVTNCFADGIYMGEDTFGHYGTPGIVSLDRVRLTGNGGMGFYARRDNGNTYHQQYYLYATNTVVAGNSSHGIYLDGVDNLASGDSPEGSAMIARLVNSTVANNAGDGLRVWGEPNGANSSVTTYNTIFANNAGMAVNLADYTNGTPVLVEQVNDFFSNSSSNLMVVGINGTVTNYPALATSDLAVDPVFCAKQPDPYRLALNSPLLNAGTNAPAPAVDILLEARPVGDFVSMGAYETGITGNGGTLIMMR